MSLKKNLTTAYFLMFFYDFLHSATITTTFYAPQFTAKRTTQNQTFNAAFKVLHLIVSPNHFVCFLFPCFYAFDHSFSCSLWFNSFTVNHRGNQQASQQHSLLDSPPHRYLLL